jgi:hypothetical protein
MRCAESDGEAFEGPLPRADLAHIRQSRPDYDLDLSHSSGKKYFNHFRFFSGFPSSLGRDLRGARGWRVWLGGGRPFSRKYGTYKTVKARFSTFFSCGTYKTVKARFWLLLSG